MNLGLLIIIISGLGYISHWLNGKFLNFKLTRWLYYLGAVVHETSHAVGCLLTGARITEFKVFNRQPHVSHTKPKLPIIGQPIVSAAPIAGGMLFLYLLNKYVLGNYIVFSYINSFQELINLPFQIFDSLQLLDWRTWILILVLLNIGSMLGPSKQDLKNFWPVLIVLLFVSWPLLVPPALLAIGLIITNIIIQLVFILLIKLFE